MALFYRESGPESPTTEPLSVTRRTDTGSHWGSPDDRRWWSPLLRDGVRPLLIAGDIAACVVAGIVAPNAAVQATMLGALLLPLFAGAGLYRSRLVLSVLDDLPRLAGAGAIALSVLLVYTYVAWGRADGFKVAAAAGVAILIVRSVSYAAVRAMRSRGVVAHSTVVVGADATGQHLVNALLVNPQYGLTPLGFVDSVTEGRAALPAPVLGAPQDLVRILDRHKPTVMILAHGAVQDAELVGLVRACHRHRCDVFVVPRLTELHSMSADVDYVWDTPLVRLQRAAYRSPAWHLKRLLDLLFATVALVLLSPIMAACALAVRREGGPGVIFRQERVGCDGVRFSLLKFRSMRPVDETESQTQWNISADDRLGPVGRLLRKTSLDELPQLFNILRGDMSLVGPRPERPHFVDQFDELYRGYSARHRVPSGLTGWAQVHGLRGNTSIEDRARFDNFYIENWSLWLDFKILLRTATSVFTAPGS